MAKELNLPKLEEKIQEYWRKNDILEEVIESRKSGKRYYFCQGPPFTSGNAHIGHAWNHAIKDSIIRYKTMQAFNVFRRAGWDMHGLPIEVKVEEDVLKSRSKKDIEEFGIENFISECKKFAIQNMNRMTEQLKRLGVWLDWDNAYMTLDSRYMEGVWFGIKKAHDQGLLYTDKQVIHWCPRCETAMSGYEVRDEYRNITDHSVFVRAKVKGKKESILIWTTTPWTLPANVAIAVHPDYDYVRAKVNDEVLILAKERLDQLNSAYELLKEFKGKELKGVKYESILDIPIQKGIKHRVVLAPDLVTLEEGTGCVHIAPGHGEEDAAIGKIEKLQVLSPVDDAGRFTCKPYEGEQVRDANEIIVRDMEEHGVLYREERITHSYPHCWRCKTPLIMRATKQWFLAISRIRDRLLKKNEEVEWIPEWIGSGRFKNWLENVKDWCISRQRYWNTPLPVWRCECGKIEVIGGIDELVKKSTQKLNPEEIDLHRPNIDKIKLKCKCGKEMQRVEDVMDVWLDSGSASWSNLGYPQQQKEFQELFPPDFITEGSDQTRGWFYSLLVGSVIAFDQIAYKKVLYHGFTLDSKGRKMSKSLGNIIDPFEVVQKYGADVLRFYMLWATAPWEDLRFNWESINNVDRMARILWNSHSFAKTYMDIDGFNPEREYKAEFQLEDLWLLSRYNSLLMEVTENMEKAYLHEVCRSLYDFVLELSRWYIKLIRERVWMESEDPRKISAYLTLYEVLLGLSTILAPIMPHFSEELYQELSKGRSVHLLNWPSPDKKRINKKLEEKMAVAQEIGECVKAARQKAGIKLRWPISRVVIAPTEELELKEVEAILLRVCNAKRLELEEIEVRVIAKPNLSRIGPKFKGDSKKLIQKLEKTDARKLKNDLEKKGKCSLDGFTLDKEDVIFEIRIPEKLVAEEFSKGIVYIDSTLDKRLLSESMAREVIRRIQEMRKELSLEELKIVNVWIECSPEFRKHVQENKEFIEKETRGKIKFERAEGYEKEWDIEGEKVMIGIQG